MMVSLLIGLVSSASAEDFNLDESFTQSVQIEDIDFVQIYCYCSNRIDIVRDETENLVLEIEANHSSIGYHGNQEIPDKIPEELLKFSVDKNANSLSLLSKEYTFIHHAFIIESLEIRVPSGVRVKITPIEYKQLEGR